MATELVMKRRAKGSTAPVEYEEIPLVCTGGWRKHERGMYYRNFGRKRVLVSNREHVAGWHAGVVEDSAGRWVWRDSWGEFTTMVAAQEHCDAMIEKILRGEA